MKLKDLITKLQNVEKIIGGDEEVQFRTSYIDSYDLCYNVLEDPEFEVKMWVDSHDHKTLSHGLKITFAEDK